MYKLFDKNTLEVYISFRTDKIIVKIYADYTGSERKNRLHVNEKMLATKIEQFWQDIKKATTKIKSLNLFFDEIDWYDDMTNIYETPVFNIERGLRKVKISSDEHGSIPKDWGVCLNGVFDMCKRSKPILDFVKLAVGNHYTYEQWAKFEKETKEKFTKNNKNEKI